MNLDLFQIYVKNHKNKRKQVIIWQNINILGASELFVLDLS